jgi:hypothetical protein
MQRMSALLEQYIKLILMILCILNIPFVIIIKGVSPHACMAQSGAMVLFLKILPNNLTTNITPTTTST